MEEGDGLPSAGIGPVESQRGPFLDKFDCGNLLPPSIIEKISLRKW